MPRHLPPAMLETHNNALANTPEYQLCAAIMLRALNDLAMEDPQIRGEATVWFARGECAWLCQVLDMDVRRVQVKARAMLRR